MLELKNLLSTLVVCLAFLLSTAEAQTPQEEPVRSMAGRSTVYAPNGMVTTSQPLASSAGLRVLQEGGNAVDAAVAAAAVLSVVEPMMTGIGGDMFALLWLAEEGRLVGLNASGFSAAAMTKSVLEEKGFDEMPLRGPETVTVPGALAGWEVLLEEHGTWSLEQVLRPAIQLAREGFPVSPVVAEFWQMAEEVLRENEEAASTFLMQGRRAPRPGDWFRNPNYAKTLEEIVREGSSYLYGGSLGRKISSHVASLGGFLSHSDFEGFSPDWVDPVATDFRGYRIWELPPNGQGIAALEMLEILEPYDLRGMGHNSAEYLHHLIEAKKLAFADLEYFVGDPRFMSISAPELLEARFTRSRREEIREEAAAHVEPDRGLTESETTYLATADPEGNMVSFINSVAATFGSGIVVPGTGFALQNRGAGFTLSEGRANTVGPRKRPFHTIIPGFVTRPVTDSKEEPWLSFGVMGGSMQPQGHVQVLLNLIVFEMELQEALDAARFRHLEGLRVGLEPVIGAKVREGLWQRGHQLTGSEEWVFYGGAQAILKLEKGWAGASEPRMDGAAAGF